MLLETTRLRLRRLDAGDASFMLELMTDPAWLHFIGDRGVRTVEEARRYIEDRIVAGYERFGFGLYRTELKETAAPIGICGLLKRDTLDDVDLGFALLSVFRGRGYAVESAAAVLAHGQAAFGLRRIVAITRPDNTASIRVLEKCGMSFERTIRLSGEAPDLALYARDFEPPENAEIGLPARPRLAQA